ncbi:MAG: two-component system, chemotaxis family, chemotaxis protein CheY [Aliidongia sp.]|jgi:DNA-binding response OmpR family regulator|nr:two-component system, chemotaxis family, chemotaxis protein CheY [Aliidongia sp.]
MSLVLVVDDDLAMQALMARLVETAGHQAVVAGDCDQGLQLFVSLSPDLVVTDLSMPDGEGSALIDEIRRKAPGTKILAVSGRLVETDSDPWAARRSLNVDAVLGKPFRVREFCDAVAGLLVSQPTISS